MLNHQLTGEAEIVVQTELRFHKVDEIAITINAEATRASVATPTKLCSPRSVPWAVFEKVCVVSRTSLCFTG